MEISSVSAFAALVQKGLRLDFGQYAQIKAPGRIVDANDGGTWVAENAPITIRAQRITSGALLQPRKLILITAFSSEIIAQSNIEAVSRAIISEGLALKLDATAFDANPGDSSRPQGLLYGVAGLTPTAAPLFANVRLFSGARKPQLQVDHHVAPVNQLIWLRGQKQHAQAMRENPPTIRHGRRAQAFPFGVHS
jgi:hypothetical protein